MLTLTFFHPVTTHIQWVLTKDIGMIYHEQKRGVCSPIDNIKYKQISIFAHIWTLIVITLVMNISVFANEKILNHQGESKQNHCYLAGLSERLSCGFITVAENAYQPQAKQI